MSEDEFILSETDKSHAKAYRDGYLHGEAEGARKERARQLREELVKEDKNLKKVVIALLSMAIITIIFTYVSFKIR